LRAYPKIEEAIFNIQDSSEFKKLALEIYRLQYNSNPVYRAFAGMIRRTPAAVHRFEDIPFLPIQFFKTQRVALGSFTPEITFRSSGTANMERSRHELYRISLYERSFRHGFKLVYGDPSQYRILALLPNYVAQGDSSLVYMVDDLIKRSQVAGSGFYLGNLSELAHVLSDQSQPTMLIGVSYALLDFSERYSMKLSNTIVMETGGMKGRRKELTREALHSELKAKLGLETIHSEYGMTELLSQAYAKVEGHFSCPPWMQIQIRDVNDPFERSPEMRGGGVNVIDLANLYSCSFIATDDLGRTLPSGAVEILGRFDFSDTRGCNLMVAGD